MKKNNLMPRKTLGIFLSLPKRRGRKVGVEAFGLIRKIDFLPFLCYFIILMRP
jgi:hypothetical protein